MARRKVNCEYCQKEMGENNYAKHKRICKKNPDNEEEVRERPGANFFITWQSHVRYIGEQLGDMQDDIKSFIICNENGAGQEEHEHSHAVIIMKEHMKMTFSRFEAYWALHELPAYQDIQACKNVKQAVKYCSKEDYL